MCSFYTMPSTRPCAAFEPISPDFDVHSLVESTPNFEWVVRIHCDMVEHQGIEAFEKLVLIHVILGGKPLVVEGYDSRLDRWTFAVQWLRDNLGSKVENPRDLTKNATVPMTFAHYLNHMALLTNQWTPTNYKDPERQRIYLKDIDCPQLWHDKLQAALPSFLYYLNDSTGEYNGFGAVDEPDPSGSGFRRGKGIGKAGDLMGCLPKEMRAENMMCYVGHEGTYTPSHREMCASLGHNIMVEASTGLVEDGKPTKQGSSIWFMTESKERGVVAEYWLSKLGHDIEIENHFAQVNAWKAAPFRTYVVEQRPGDFILIPRLAPHQVWNRGTRTMKVAWNRTTVETLEMALKEALPHARMVCRDEQYKNKAMIYFALQKYSKLLRQAEKFKQKKPSVKHKSHNDIKVRQLEKDFRRLHGLYNRVLLSESFLPQQQDKAELVPFEGFITCSYCRCNIFNRFLTCSSCVVRIAEGEEDTYDVCMECYAMGRSCACISKLKWVEQFPWTELIQKHDQWRQQILGYEGKVTEKSPMSLKTELQRLDDTPTLAQICQVELKRRPWRDITKPPPQVDAADREEEIELDINGNVKKTKKKVRRSEKFMRDHGRCHIDQHWEPRWKQAQCSECDKFYCYGSLFRAYDERPEAIMANPSWTCPSCRNICACRKCRHKPGYKPYTPSTTYLGHNTKLVADPRSVESLVDFSLSNIGWIQKAGDDGDDTRRLKRRRHEADAAQAEDPDLGDDYADEQDQQNADDVEDRLLRLAQQEGVPIDPALGAMNVSNGVDPVSEEEDVLEENPEGRRGDLDSSARGPPVPQYVVPEGGIIRDYDHIYDFTEAITYDYPDPDMGIPIPVPPEPAEVQSGYGPAAPDSPSDKIEMVSRKRKRNKLDEGDRAFAYNKPVSKEKPKAPEKPKKRRSLIVKLQIKKEKLLEVNKMAVIAQRALNGVGGAAPVIGSDLQALNTTPNVEGQQSSKKARLDQVLVDRDDEYAPGRRRERRKLRPDGVALPPHPDSEITRRTTRMQAVTYEEPDEDEFGERLGDGPRPTSKLATMEHAIDIDSGSDESEQDAESQDDDEMDVDAVEPSLLERQPSPRRSEVSRPSPINASPPQRESIATLQPESESQPQTSAVQDTRSSTASSMNTAKDQTKALAAAQANRAAKMAALDGMDDSDSLDEGFSDDISEASPPRKPQSQVPQQREKPVSIAREVTMSSAATSNSSSPAPEPSTAIPKPPIESNPASTKPRQSLPTTTSKAISTPHINDAPQRTVSERQPQRVIVKATAADWGDSDSSDSDDSGPATVKNVVSSRGGGWASVNAMSTGRGNHAAGLTVKRGRGRGRPARAG